MNNIVCASLLTDDYVDIAQSLANNGEYSKAMNYINKALAVEPQNNKLQELKNDLLKMTGQNVTNNVASGYFATNPNVLEAENLRSQRNYPKAIVAYRKVLKENPNFTPAYLGLAVSFYELKNYQEAKQNLDIYLNKEPQADIAYMLRAKTNMNLGEPQSALRDIKSAQVYSNNLEYLLTEAVILAEQGKYSQAKDILENISDEIQIYTVFRYLGLCYYKLGNYKDAVLNFDRAIILFDDDKSILPMYNDAKRKCNEG